MLACYIHTTIQALRCSSCIYWECGWGVTPPLFMLLNAGSAVVIPPRLTREFEPMLFYCWPTVGPTLKQHWFNVSSLLGRFVDLLLA